MTEITLTKITTENFREFVLESKVPVVVLIRYTDSALGYIYERKLEYVSNHYDGEIKIATLPMLPDSPIINEYDIQQVPTILVFNSGKLVDKFAGLISERALYSKLKKSLKND